MTTFTGKLSGSKRIRCCLLLMLASNAAAQNYSWTNTGISGIYESEGNWTPNGIPDSNLATAIFGLPNETHVGMFSSKQLGNLTVANNADLYFAPAGIDPPDRTLAINGLTDITQATLSVGAQGASTSNVDLIGGDFKIDGNLNATKGARIIGTNARMSTEVNRESHLTVSGNPGDAASTASQFIFNDITVGERGDARVTIAEGARFIADTVTIAEHASSHSAFIASGTTANGYRTTVATNLEFGAGDAYVDVTHGAAMYTGGVVMGSDGLTSVSVAGSASGTRALWDVDGPLVVGTQGRGLLYVHHAGELRTRGAEVATLPESFSEVQVNSLLGGQAAIWHNMGDLALGGTHSMPGGQARALVDDSGQLIVDGKIKIWRGGRLQLRGGRVIANWIDHTDNGTLHLESGELVAEFVTGNLDNIGAKLHVDRVEGSVVNQAGVLDPGRIMGATVITGDYVQHSDAWASFVIGGTLDEEFDRLDVAGNAILDGKLTVGLRLGFSPERSDEFEIITAGTRDGLFNNLTEGNRVITRGNQGAFRVTYEPNSVILSDFIDMETVDFDNNGTVDCADVNALTGEVAAGSNSTDFDLNGDGSVDLDDLDQWLADAGAINLPSGGAYLPGDANLDGSVDVSDFNIWNRHKFNDVSRWCSADFNADGFVDVGDFNLWNANKFSSADSSVASVPEPELGMISLLVMLGMIMLRRSV